MAKLTTLNELHLTDETRGIPTCIFPFIKNKTDNELAMVYRELSISREDISQSQHDSPDIELCQRTKTSKASCHNITVYPEVENSETKTQSDTCDRLIIATDSINQDGDVGNDDRFHLNPNRTS